MIFYKKYPSFHISAICGATYAARKKKILLILPHIMTRLNTHPPGSYRARGCVCSIHETTEAAHRMRIFGASGIDSRIVSPCRSASSFSAS